MKKRHSKVPYLLFLSSDVPKIKPLVPTLKQVTAVNQTSVEHDTEKINLSKLIISLIQIICIVLYHYFRKKKLYRPIIFYFTTNN